MCKKFFFFNFYTAGCNAQSTLMAGSCSLTILSKLYIIRKYSYILPYRIIFCKKIFDITKLSQDDLGMNMNFLNCISVVLLVCREA